MSVKKPLRMLRWKTGSAMEHMRYFYSEWGLSRSGFAELAKERTGNVIRCSEELEGYIGVMLGGNHGNG